MNNRGAYQRMEANKSSLRARYEALKNPAYWTAEFRAALSGQGKFAALSIPSLGIHPMSLNTMKSLAKSTFIELDGPEVFGFKELDQLRAAVLRSVSHSQDADKANAGNRVKSSETLLAEVKALQVQSALRSRAYSKLIEELKQFTVDPELGDLEKVKIASLLKRHYQIYSQILSPSPATEHSDAATDGRLLVVIPGGRMP